MSLLFSKCAKAKMCPTFPKKCKVGWNSQTPSHATLFLTTPGPLSFHSGFSWVYCPWNVINPWRLYALVVKRIYSKWPTLFFLSFYLGPTLFLPSAGTRKRLPAPQSAERIQKRKGSEPHWPWQLRGEGVLEPKRTTTNKGGTLSF